jgi:hypothetical protein
MSSCIFVVSLSLAQISLRNSLFRDSPKILRESYNLVIYMKRSLISYLVKVLKELRLFANARQFLIQKHAFHRLRTITTWLIRVFKINLLKKFSYKVLIKIAPKLLSKLKY